jgi:hypothetical protein
MAGRLSIGKKDADNPLSGTQQDILEKIPAYVDLGVDYFIFESNQIHEPKILSQMVNELLPAIRELKAKTPS